MRVCSGIQPTGVFHLGNYFGSLVNWIQMQQDGHECFFFIANQHAITLPQKADELKKQTLNAAATLLAIGLDPEKSTIFVQSDVPEHSQLAWILNCLAPMGQMERMIQFKEKSEKNPNTTNVGLFSYPILQAADILLYKANLVPVGIDQAQHLELTRILAKKFNTTYKEVFIEPKTLHTKTTKIIGLDGENKMSKSLNNYIGLTEDPKIIWEKIKTATTDPARVKKTDPGNPEICNIHSLHKLFSTEDDKKWVINGCTKANIGCVECKKKLFENMEIFLKPIRGKYNSLIQNPEMLKRTLAIGAQKARTTAKETLTEVYNAIGFKY